MNSTLSLTDLESLENNGFVVLNSSKFSLLQVAQLKTIASRLYHMQSFKAATIGESKNQQPMSAIRNDFTLWLDESSWPENLEPVEHDILNSYFKFLHQTKDDLKNFFRISLNSFETHFAVYPKNHFYKKHRDQTALNNRRYFSFVVYLNENWSPSDGGYLVGYQDQQKIFEVTPHAQNIIIFRSDLEHEVLPSFKERFSITGWFRND